MRVVVGERLGGPEVLSVAERAAPRPGPGEIVVDVAAAGVNFMDIYLLLTRMVRRRGGVVVATTSGGEKAELARGRGRPARHRLRQLPRRR